MSFLSTIEGLIPKGNLVAMDPVTAGLNALTSFNAFLVTPAGQKLATDAEDLIKGIFTLLNAHLTSNVASQPSNPPKTT